MKTKIAKRVSTVFVGAGIILIILPIFNLFPNISQALLFAGFISIFFGFVIEQVNKKDKRRKREASYKQKEAE